MTDYFATLGLPRRLELELATLNQHYRQLSWDNHPDLRPRIEQAAAMAQTAQINEAYRTLKDPFRRAQHLLELEGIPLEQKPPQALLVEVFELQELLEDPDTLETQLQAQQAYWQRRTEQLTVDLDSAFSQWDQDGKAALLVLKDILVQRTYLFSLLEKIDAALQAKRAGQ
ncbi:Fe-S protein assembly co-chaperone HscB [Anthocerotibacter panamensis]|uniref:Fe-S protein assembly co-chaperone HscB n=1 Tax=Anthocerotibacter panamensis TaxID=2857077 RepID=UPI001C406A99|nr:Fe-S protein assembly co-chaperone HscB [Anthocerotibacter panamensis]